MHGHREGKLHWGQGNPGRQDFRRHECAGPWELGSQQGAPQEVEEKVTSVSRYPRTQPATGILTDKPWSCLYFLSAMAQHFQDPGLSLMGTEEPRDRDLVLAGSGAFKGYGVPMMPRY